MLGVTIAVDDYNNLLSWYRTYYHSRNSSLYVPFYLGVRVMRNPIKNVNMGEFCVCRRRDKTQTFRDLDASSVVCTGIRRSTKIIISSPTETQQPKQ